MCKWKFYTKLKVRLPVGLPSLLPVLSFPRNPKSGSKISLNGPFLLVLTLRDRKYCDHAEFLCSYEDSKGLFKRGNKVLFMCINKVYFF